MPSQIGTSFTYSWIEPVKPGLVSTKNVLDGRRDMPVGMVALTVDVSALAEPARFGDIVLVKGLAPIDRVNTAPIE